MATTNGSNIPLGVATGGLSAGDPAGGISVATDGLLSSRIGVPDYVAPGPDEEDTVDAPGLNILALPGGINGDHRVYSNFFSDRHVIQQVAMVQPKNLLIDGLRRIFRGDNIYTYRDDEYGYPLTGDHTGEEIGSSNLTQILISDIYRYEIKHYPAITIKSGGGSYKPVSFNQNATIKYRKDIVVSDFGGQSIVRTPTHRIYAGMWDLRFDVNIYSKSQTELEELTDIVSISLQNILREELRANGLFINKIGIGGESAEKYSNDYIYSQVISVPTISEWRVEIPIDNVIEKLVFYFESTRHPIPGVKTDADVLSTPFSELIELAEVE